ncbi:MAG: C39 family peptidase [Clostridia bacterium]|nr:C39 family peptidase [Clostridia bacterium]
MKKHETTPVSIVGNHVKLTCKEAFTSGQLVNLVYTDKLGDGAVRMKKPGEALFLTPVFTTDRPFNDMVASWNTETPAGTWAEVFGRVYLPEYDGWTDRDGNTYDGWTDWITWGQWSTHIARNCPECQDTHPRKDSEETNGWAFAYSKPGYGDSSLNVRGDYTASAFQLKVVLHAAEDCQALPALRLLAATWKNTNDPDWQNYCTYPEEPVECAPSVLLDTPAISQKARDPDYGGVICSATCATMLMNGLGADLLPEDVTLLGVDYGFGGNGNWSFTCATAGAYGYEAYVSYSSFAAIRQELSRGYAVCLSVKYSNKPDDDQPYLENAPQRVAGHLITIVGYYFNQELGEYVYCSNDPATKTDAEVAHREYRESQLDKCWYRRAAYFIHEKEAGAGLYVRDYVTATLMPVKERPGLWALTTEDSLLRIPQDFQENKRKVHGQHGTICYYADDEITAIPNTCKRVTANHAFRYTGITVTEEGYLSFENDDMSKLLAQGKTVKLLVLDNCDTVYTAVATAHDVFDPADLVTPEEEARQEKIRLLAKTGAIVAGTAAAVAALAGVVKFLSKKKK